MTELRTLGKYTIEGHLGRGAMGEVYKGFDPHIERTVALKTIRKDRLEPETAPALLTRFKREAQAAGRLAHANIVTVFEYGEDEGTAFIAMEYVEGRTLKEIFSAGERFPLRAALALMGQLLDALAYSHRQGVVHRDIKPANIIVLPNGRIKVTDFGIAHLESSNLTQFGEVLGTPSYMSPEQCMGDTVDRRSDLFSAGVIFYQLLTGEKPFPGESMTTVMHRVLNVEPLAPSTLNLQLPAPLDRCLFKALAKKPAERFQSAEEFFAAVKAALKGGEMGTAPGFAAQGGIEETVVEPAKEKRAILAGGPGLVGLLALLLAAALLLGWFLLARPRPEPARPEADGAPPASLPAAPPLAQDEAEREARPVAVPPLSTQNKPVAAPPPQKAVAPSAPRKAASAPPREEEHGRVRLTTKPRPKVTDAAEEPVPAPNRIIGIRPRTSDR